MSEFRFRVPKRQQTTLTPNPTKIPSTGRFRILVNIKAAVPAIMDVIIHLYLNLFGKNKANVNGTKTAVERSPIDKNPRSLMNEPENVAATNTDINNIPTIVSLDTLRFLEDSFNDGFIFIKTSRTRIVEEPNVKPEPPIMIVINNVPRTIPPRNSGIQCVMKSGNACAVVAMTPMFSGNDFPASAIKFISSAVT